MSKEEIEEQCTIEVEEDEENDDEQEEGEYEENDVEAIDISDNDMYRALSTVLEDDEGNNILEYISLLHTELIGLNKSLENLRFIRKDLTRLVDTVEVFVKGKSSDTEEKKVKSANPEEKRVKKVIK